MNTVSPPVVRLFRDEIAELISTKFGIEGLYTENCFADFILVCIGAP
jgi:hypothetical protein